MKKIDCLGDICPIPIIKTKKELHSAKPGDSFMVITDHSCTLDSIIELLNNYNVQYDYEEIINGVWEVTITQL